MTFIQLRFKLWIYAFGGKGEARFIQNRKAGGFINQVKFYGNRVSKCKLIKRIGIGFAIFIIITAITMVFVTGYIVFHNTSQLVSNDEAYFENSMAYFEERGFDYSGLLETYNVEKVELTSSYDGHTIPAELIYANSKTMIRLS